MKTLFALLLLFSCAATYAQQDPLPQQNPVGGETDSSNKSSSKDYLLVGGELDHNSGIGFGGNNSVDWLRVSETGSFVSAGAAAYSTGGSRWILARGGVAYHVAKRWTLTGSAIVGGGDSSGSSFAYQTYQAGVAYQPAAPIHLRLEEEFVRIAGTQGNLIKPGVLWLPAKHLSLDFSYAHSLLANFETQYATGRAEYALRRMRLLAGFATGNLTPALVNVAVGVPQVAESLDESFAGAAVPIRRCELMLIVDVLNVGTTRRRSLALNLKLPLGRD